jgi:hypothetical protein
MMPKKPTKEESQRMKFQDRGASDFKIKKKAKRRKKKKRAV